MSKSNPIADQGKAAAKMKLGHKACPYAEGDHRDDWLKAYGPDDAAAYSLDDVQAGVEPADE